MKKRTLSAIVLMLLLIGSFIINSKLFSILMLLVSIMGFNEFFTIKYKDNNKCIRLVKYMGMFLVGLIVVGSSLLKIDMNILIMLPLIVLGIPIVFYNMLDKYNIEDYFYVLGIVYLLGMGFGNISNLAINRPHLCIFIFLIAFLTDTYAYISGSLIGRCKFTSISPNKTIEGTVIGLIMGSIIGITYYYNVIGDMSLVGTVILCLLLSMISEIGDLLFSSIKRHFNKKDFSDLIPGHGGVLDRFDSVIYVSLGVMLFLSILVK